MNFNFFMILVFVVLLILDARTSLISLVSLGIMPYSPYSMCAEDDIRVTYYLGVLSKQPSFIVKADHQGYYTSFGQLVLRTVTNRFRSYDWVLIKLFLKYGEFWNTPLYFRPGDVVTNSSNPTLCKTRPATSEMHNNVLLPFEYYRHWSDVLRIKKWDIPFDEKKGIAVWRGVSTGYDFKTNTNKGRRALVEKYNDADPDVDKIDVGLTELVQGVTSSVQCKKKLSIKEQLEYKYLISIEGNDVSTGLKWMLNSNSVVLMAPPTICSWFMEDKLVPFKHYVPLKQDYSDLPEVISWCESNPILCKQISRNARDYVSQFLDLRKEVRIAERVFCTYMKAVRISPSAP